MLKKCVHKGEKFLFGFGHEKKVNEKEKKQLPVYQIVRP